MAENPWLVYLLIMLWCHMCRRLLGGAPTAVWLLLALSGAYWENTLGWNNVRQLSVVVLGGQS
jgi:hypothetical protein